MSSGATIVGHVLQGLGGSPGIVVGKAFVVGARGAQNVARKIDPPNPQREQARVRDAVNAAQDSLRGVVGRMTQGAPNVTPILDAYMLMLDDPMMMGRVSEKLEGESLSAEWAIFDACSEIADAIADAAEDDAYMRERSHDVSFVRDLLLRTLSGDDWISSFTLREPMIVVAADLSPAETASFAQQPVIGLVTEMGSRTSHTSIVARALEVPAVVGAQGALVHIKSGDTIIVDGSAGRVLVNPSPDDIARAVARMSERRAFAERLSLERDRPTTTACGVRVHLRANVELATEVKTALERGADGIGLFRTEFLYIQKSTLPTEDEQFELYKSVLEAADSRPVNMRTFDLGGDKFSRAMRLPPEPNPALGLRAVRLALREPAVFLAQLRALVRASAFGDLRITVPMITTVTEMRRVRELLRIATDEVDRQDLHHAEEIPLGMMVEVPTAAIMADVFAREADFFSLGTNDLVQYCLAADRMSRALAPLATPFDPGVLRLIRGVAKAAFAGEIPLSVCGAMASDPLAAILLLGLGLRDLSLESASILEVKQIMSRVTLAEAEAAAEEALCMTTAVEVEQHLDRLFGERIEESG